MKNTMKKGVLLLALALVVAAGAFAQQYIPWGARNEKSLLVFPGAQTESYSRVNFVKIVGGGDSKVVEAEYFTNNVFSVKKTTLNVLNSQSGRRSLGNPTLIRIKTSHYQFIEVEAFTSEEKTPGVRRTKPDRFFVIMPDSDYIFNPRVLKGAFEGTGGSFDRAGSTAGSDHIAYDVALMDREALDDFMDYIVSTVNYDDARAKVDSINRAFKAMTDKTKCAYNIGCNCKGDVAEHLIYEVSFKQGLLGAITGGFPPWAAPAEFLAARVQLQAQAILACTLGMYHSRINLRRDFTNNFKNHCYVLFGNASPPNVTALGAVRENTIIEMGQNILQTIAPRGLSAAVPFVGTAVGVITGGAINAGETRAFGLKANAFYKAESASGTRAVPGVVSSGLEFIRGILEPASGTEAAPDRPVAASGNLSFTAVPNSPFGTSAIYSVAFGNNTWVAVGAEGKIAYSSDARTWTLVTWTTASPNPFTNTRNNAINGVVFANGKFIAVGNGKMVSSTDGRTWTAGTIPVDSRSFAFGNNRWVTMAWAGNAAYSTDGTNWTAVKVGDVFGTDSSSGISGLAYGNNRWVAASAPNRVIGYSTNGGVNWTRAANSPISGANAIAFGNNRFVAGEGNGKMATSTDGANWTAVADSAFGRDAIIGITFGSNRFVAVGTGGKAAYSADGVNWTAIANTGFPATNSANRTYTIWSVAFGNNRWVAVGVDGKIAYSN